MADFLVTGTDTGVGKTLIAAALVKSLRARGVRALGFKPAETGVDGRDAPDSDRLQRASGDANPLATPLLQLAEPLAPAVAADRAGTPIHPQQIEDRLALLRREGYTVVVEGAGGVLVPLAWEKASVPYYTVLDLAQRCGLEAIVVARAGLGTLNHTALTVGTLQSRNIPVRAVVLNGGAVAGSDGDLAAMSNPAVLARMLADVRVLEVPHFDGADVIDAAIPYLTALL